MSVKKTDNERKSSARVNSPAAASSIIALTSKGTAVLDTTHQSRSRATAKLLIDGTLAKLPEGLEQVPEAPKWGLVFTESLDTALGEKIDEALQKQTNSVSVGIHELSAWSVLNKRSKGIHIEAAANEMQGANAISSSQISAVKKALADMNDVDGLQSFLESKGYKGNKTARLEDLLKINK
jgi:hypothetical protein